jgi:GNAT superfamily N-acetyltransferase
VTFEAAREAAAADLPRLAELARQGAAELAQLRGGAVWALREGRRSAGASDLVARLEDPSTFVVAGTFDDVVVGFATVRREALPDGSSLAVLDDLYVEPGARGVGVGEAMMGVVLAWCEAQQCRGIDSLALPGDRATKNFFERFGLTARAILVHRALGEAAGDDELEA